ncbi:LOW QUALITY PROTEIN: reverse transcriptase [Phytophthora megakarya]|uniref:Reverse transcriptase n=1 Tax=Phytophthora megakarya TaxID=4795 RepID=A0A225UCJ6_9STRA|nr:LOW QUALITY PROTEIN: reverse transcriptase [Phytophthora megakarya]
MVKEATQARIQQVLEAENGDRGSQEGQEVDHRKTLDLEAPDPTEADPRWIHAHRSFSALKVEIATTLILRHFDPDRRATVVVYASDWAISGSLMQEYDQIYYPVMFASRTLKSNELNDGIAEKGVLALQRTLDLNYNALVGRPIHVLSRHSTLAWLFRSTGGLGQWAALLPPWTLEITKWVKEEDDILGSLAATITPRSEMDKTLISIAPKKEPRRKIQALLKNLDPRRLVICGVSNLVIRQVRSEIDCKAPDLQLLRQRALDRLRTWPDHELLHVKRDWNGSADSWQAPLYNGNVGSR